MICRQGDIIEVDLEPSVGHEPNKVRPALVVSSDDFNIRSSLAAICPVTSVDNGYPMHVGISDEDSGVSGFVCVEALRTVDLGHRKCRTVGRSCEKVMSDVLNFIGAMFDI